MAGLTNASTGGRPFNVILSDGMHEAKAVINEMTQLLGRGLMNKQTIMLWDDCGTGTGLAKTVEKTLFGQIVAAMPGEKVCYVRVAINSWVGTAEAPVGCCLISTGDTVNLESLFGQRDLAAAPEVGGWQL